MGTLLPAGPEAISLAAAALARGELVAFPTETVYGLGASAASETAIDEVFRLKGRPRSHPLIVHLPSADDLWRWADRDAQAASGIAPEAVEALATAVWPGPVTLVLRADANVPALITGAQDTVAVRLPGNETALALLREFGGALVAPSANRFGRVSPTTAQHVADEFPGELLVLDGGPTELGLESTIVDLSTERPRLLRPGAMASGRIEELLGMPLARQAIAAVSAQAPGDPIAGVPRVPGSLDHHYAPAAPVRLASRGELSRSEAAAGLIVIAPGGSTQTVATGNARVVKELPDDARGYAKRLYATLRELDAAGVSEIVVEMPPAGDEWLAVRDRLARASAAPHAGTRGDRTHGHEPTDVADTGRSAAHGRDDKNKLVAIVMGSASDWETMRHADELLSSFGVPHSCQVVSAHRTPARMASFAAAAAANGYKVIIAGAGGAAHLPGMIAAQTHLPVLGVPVQSAALSGLDSLLSQVQMPRGVPVGTLAIGPAGALNAALLAVAILAVSDDALRSKLIAYRSEQTAAAEAATLPTPNFLP